jgi:hypothetical protein
MNVRKSVVLALLLSFCFVSGTSAQKTPKITISTTKIAIPGHVDVQGAGFTPKHNVSSHLLKPDGTEYPVLPLLTDDRGAFTHEIDTLLLAIGVHELWVVDDDSKTPSNRVKFEVTR